MQANKKLKELESALIKLAEDVSKADGRADFNACLSNDGEIQEFAEAAWVCFSPVSVYICFPRNQAIADARRHYEIGMEPYNRITVRSDIDFDATTKAVKDLHDAFLKNGIETLKKDREKKKADEREMLVKRLAEIDNAQPVTN